MMKILHIEAGKKLYGGARQVLWLMKGLAEKGVGNVLVCPDTSVIAKEAAQFAKIIALPLRGDLDFTLTPALYRMIRRERPDIVHVHSRRGADSFGLLGARLASFPIVLTRRVDHAEFSWWAKRKYALVDHIIVISEAIQKVLIQAGVNPQQISLVHSAVAPYTSMISQKDFHQTFNLNREDFAIGVVAQLIPRKGHRYLIEAMPGILDRFPRSRFLFFGQGAMEETLKKLVKQKALEHAVIFAGFHDNVRDFLPHLDLLVHPALMEGLGVALLEASFAGVPIVASRAGGIPEVVLDGENGLLVPSGDAQALTQAIVTALADSDLRKKLGEGGRRLVEERFSVASMIEGNLKVYEAIVAQALVHNRHRLKG
jgi:glycosyltransferase involved in cell wall biosynthesis